MNGPCFEPGAAAIRLAGAAGIGAAGLLVLGLRDDRRSWSPLSKGIAQGLLLLCVLLLWRPEGRLASWTGLGLAWLCGMVLVNAWNYLDHADGIFASTAAVASAVLAGGLAAGSGWGCASGLMWSFCGAMLGFAVWNRPPARIFLGDAGSLPLGFLLVLAALAVVDSGPPRTVPVAVGAHCVALTDLFLVTIARLRDRRGLFLGGRDHSAHRLTRLLGARATMIVFILGAAGYGAVSYMAGARLPVGVTAILPMICLLLAVTLLRLPPPASIRTASPPV
jgi:UDP-GlcNAc:undecaprenyl-phosphate GlcNAc-1-phosphate transferase